MNSLQSAGKDLAISPFEATRSLLTGQGVTDISSRLNMYFVDYSLMSLFIQVLFIFFIFTTLVNNRLFAGKLYY